MPPATRRIASRLAAVALALVLPGCGVELGILAAGASAAQSGVSFFSRGRLHSYEVVRMEEVVIASDRAAETLALRRINQRFEEDRVWRYYQDGQGQKIEVEIQERTSRVTAVTIDVGSLGKRGMASLYLRQLLDELSEMDAYLEDWDHIDPRAGGGGTVDGPGF